MTSLSYEYTDRDLFEEPESYEYSEIHGKPFLDTYLEDRAGSIHALDQRLTSTDEQNCRWNGLLNTFEWSDGGVVRSSLPVELPSGVRIPEWETVPDPSEISTVKTIPLLAQLLGYPNECPPDSEWSKVWTNHLIERFEVSKRLYVGYDGDMRPLNDETAPRVAYPMLALAGLLIHERTGSLKHLNGVLKLCDALSSADPGMMTPDTAALARLALNEERYVIQSLATSKGISL